MKEEEGGESLFGNEHAPTSKAMAKVHSSYACPPQKQHVSSGLRSKLT